MQIIRADRMSGNLPLFSLLGRTALVTGSVRGLGFEILKGFAEAGAKVIVHGRRIDEVQEVVNRLAAQGYQAQPAVFDLDDSDSVRAELKRLFSLCGSIDILCNNAGMRDRRGLADLNLDEIRRVINTNLLSVIDLCQQFLAYQPQQMNASILNITSLQGHLLRRADFAYPISKQAVEAMTRALAVEYGPLGLRCNAIAPGSFETAFNADLLSKPENQARAAQRNPLQRWGIPSEIIGPAVFLVSEAASYVNGITLKVDGGYGISF